MLPVAKKVIVIGSSTGGVEAVDKVLSQLPVTVPPILIVQHMPPGITKLFATRLNTAHAVAVKEAEDGDQLVQGQVLIAPAGKHMKVVHRLGKLFIELFVGEKVQYVMPSADVLFESVAEIFGRNAIGVILTGMGADGARGLKKMRDAGAKTIGQNKETCVIYGMPKVAFEMGAVEHQLPINAIADKIMRLV